MEIHEMKLDFDYKGMQGWICPTCGRKILLGVPHIGMAVLVEGDVYASHHGSSGGLSISSTVQVDRHLDVWKEAISKLDFD